MTSILREAGIPGQPGTALLCPNPGRVGRSGTRMSPLEC